MLLYKRNRRICIKLATDITFNNNNNNNMNIHHSPAISLFVLYNCCRELHFTIWFKGISNDYRSMVNGFGEKWQKMIHKSKISLPFGFWNMHKPTTSTQLSRRWRGKKRKNAMEIQLEKNSSKRATSSTYYAVGIWHKAEGYQKIKWNSCGNDCIPLRMPIQGRIG